MALTDSLKAYYRFSAGALTTDAINSYTLVNSNSVAENASGKVGGGADFGSGNTSKSFYRAPDMVSYTQMATGFTFSCWVYVNSLASNNRVTRFILNNGSLERNFQVDIDTNGYVLFGCFDGAGHSVNQTTNALATNTWYHLVWQYDGTAGKLFVNAVEKASVTWTWSGYARTSYSSLHIGSEGLNDGAGTGEWFKGMIDEYGIWDRALTGAEITSLYNSGSALQFPFGQTLSNNLTNYYKLDGNSNDAVGSNNGSDSGITYNAGNGIITQGAGLAGSTNRITLATQPFSGNTMSYSVWFKTSTAGRMQILGFGDSAQAKGLFLELYTDSKLATDWSGVSGANSTMTLNDGVWHHVVMSVSNGTCQMYLDGAKLGSPFGGGTLNIDTSGYNGRYIGCRLYGDNVTNWNGAIDELGIWSRALYPAEVAQLYNARAALSYPFTTGKVKALLVGGGGGGGGYFGGGGGGGDVEYNEALSITNQAYSVVIGTAGTWPVGVTPGSTAGNTTFNSITAYGGGNGAVGGGTLTPNGRAATSGGSGGGGGSSDYSAAGAAGSGNRVYAGGSAGGGGGTYASAGGGGAGGAGGSVTGASTVGGVGGLGYSSSISGSALTYGGGGGGACSTLAGGTVGGSGNGGGGNGSLGDGGGQYVSGGTAARANSGGGGGGGYASSVITGMAGADGTLVLSYATNGSDGIYPTSTGGTITTAGDQTIHTFTSNGTFTPSFSGGTAATGNMFLLL